MSVSRPEEILTQGILHVPARFPHERSQQKIPAVLNRRYCDEDDPDVSLASRVIDSPYKLVVLPGADPSTITVLLTNVPSGNVPSCTSFGPQGRVSFHMVRANSKRRAESFSYRLFSGCHRQQVPEDAGSAYVQ
jgi:hypothetical protein